MNKAEIGQLKQKQPKKGHTQKWNLTRFRRHSTKIRSQDTRCVHNLPHSKRRRRRSCFYGRSRCWQRCTACMARLDRRHTRALHLQRSAQTLGARAAQNMTLTIFDTALTCWTHNLEAEYIFHLNVAIVKLDNISFNALHAISAANCRLYNAKCSEIQTLACRFCCRFHRCP